jgi:chemotaxis protein MotB
LTKHLSERDSIISSLEEALERFVKEAEGLRRERADREKHVYELETRASELSSLANRSKALQRMASNATSDRDAAVALAETNQKLALGLERELADSRKQSPGHQELELLRKELQERAAEVARLRAGHVSTERSLQASHDAEKSRAEAHRGEVESLAQQLAVQRTLVEALQAQVEEVGAEKANLQEQMKEMALEKSDLEEHVNISKEGGLRMAASITVAQANVDRLSSQVADQDNAITELETVRDIAEAKCRTLQSELGQVVSALAVLQRGTTGTSAATAGEEGPCGRNAGKIVELALCAVKEAEQARELARRLRESDGARGESDLAAARKVEQLEGQVQSLRGERGALEQAAVERQRSDEKLREHARLADETSSTLRASLDGLQSQASDRDRRMAQAEKVHRAAQERCKLLQAENARVSGVLAQLESELSECGDDSDAVGVADAVSSLIRKHDGLRRQLAESASGSGALASKCAALEQELDDARALCDEAQEGCKSAQAEREAILGALTSLKASLPARDRAVVAVHDGSGASGIPGAVEFLVRQQKDLRQQLDANVLGSAALEAKCAALEQELQDAQGQCSARQAENERIGGVLATLTSKLAGSDGAPDDPDVDRVAKAVESILRQRDVVQRQLDVSALDSGALESKCVALEQELGDSQSTCRTMQERCEEYRTENERVASTLASLKSTLLLAGTGASLGVDERGGGDGAVADAVEALVRQREELRQELDAKSLASGALEARGALLERERDDVQKAVFQATARFTEEAERRRVAHIRAQKSIEDLEGQLTRERSAMRAASEKLSKDLRAIEEEQRSTNEGLEELCHYVSGQQVRRPDGGARVASTSLSEDRASSSRFASPGDCISHLRQHVQARALELSDAAEVAAAEAKAKGDATRESSRIRDECREVRCALEGARSDGKKGQAELSAARQSLSAKGVELTALKVQLQAVNGELDAARAELLSSGSESGVLMGRLAVAAGEQRALEDQLERRQSELEEARGQLEVVLGNAEVLAARLKAAQEDSRALARDAHAVRAECAALRTESADVAARLQTARVGKERAEAQLQAVYASKSDDTSELARERVLLREESDGAQNEIRKLIAQLDSLRHQVDEKRDREASIARERLIGERKAEQDADKRLAELTAARAGLEAEVAGLRSQLEKACKAQGEAGKQVTELTAARARLTADLSASNKRCEEACTASRQADEDLAEATAARARLEAESEAGLKAKLEADEQVAELAAARAHILAEVDDWRERCDEACRSRREADGRVAELEAAMADSQDRRSAALRTEQDAGDQVAELTAERERLTGELSDCRRESEASCKLRTLADARVAELTATCARLEVELARSRSQHERACKSKQEADELVATLTAERASLALETERAASTARDWEVSAKAAQAAKADSDKLAVTAGEKAASQRAIAVRCAGLEERLEGALSLVAAAQSAKEGADAAVLRVEGERDILQTKLADAEARIQSHNAAAAEMASSFRELEDQAARLGREDGALASYLDTIDNSSGASPTETAGLGGDASAPCTASNMKRVTLLQRRCAEAEQSRRQLLSKIEHIRAASGSESEEVKQALARKVERQMACLRTCDEDLAFLKEEIGRLEAVDMDADVAKSEVLSSGPDSERRKEAALEEILAMLEVREAGESGAPTNSTVELEPAESAVVRIPPVTEVTGPPADVKRDELGNIINPDTSWITARPRQ